MICVTGASGFIGQAVMEVLPDAVAIPHTDVGSQPIDADIIINIAWPSSPAELRDYADLQERGIDFSRRLLESSTSRLKRFIGFGSQAEINLPDLAYALAKLKTREEAAATCQSRGVEFAWVQPFSIYGPGDNPNALIPFVVRELLAGRTPALTSCNRIWDYLHVEDAARAIALLAKSQATGIFELGSGEPVLLRSVVEMIRDKINPAATLGFGRRPERPVEVLKLLADISRLQQLGWKPTVSLDSGLDSVITEYR